MAVNNKGTYYQTQGMCRLISCTSKFSQALALFKLKKKNACILCLKVMIVTVIGMSMISMR